MCLTACYRLAHIISAQGRCGLQREGGAWKFRQNSITDKFDDSTLVAPNDFSGECLKDFNQLKRARFVFRSTCAVPGHVRKPDRNQAMGKECSLHCELARSSMHRDSANVEPGSSLIAQPYFLAASRLPQSAARSVECQQSPKSTSSLLATSFLITNASAQTCVAADRARLTSNGCPRLFDKKRNQGERCDAIQPPPIEQLCRCQADHQNDRQITARDRFDRVGS